MNPYTLQNLCEYLDDFCILKIGQQNNTYFNRRWTDPRNKNIYRYLYRGRFLLVKYCDFNWHFGVSMVCSGGHLDTVDLMMRVVKSQNRWNGYLAGYTGNDDLIRMIDDVNKVQLFPGSRSYPSKRSRLYGMAGACYGGHLELIKKIHTSSREMLKQTSYVLRHAVRRYTDLKVVQEMVDVFIDQSEELGKWDLIGTCQGGHVELVAKILASASNLMADEVLASMFQTFDIDEILEGTSSLPISDVYFNMINFKPVAVERQQQIIELLIEKGVSQLSLSKALISRSRDGDWSMVDFLIEKGAQTYNVPGIILFWASRRGNLERVKYALRMVDDLDRGSGIYQACQGGHLEIVEYLIGTDFPGKYAKGGLKRSCSGGHVHLVNWWLKQGATNYASGFQEACRGRRKYINPGNPVRFPYRKIMKLLIKKGVKQCVCGLSLAEHFTHRYLAP